MAAGCTPRTLGCGVAGGAVDCTRVGITGRLGRIDLSGQTDPAPTSLILAGPGNTIAGLGAGCITGADGSLNLMTWQCGIPGKVRRAGWVMYGLG